MRHSSGLLFKCLLLLSAAIISRTEREGRSLQGVDSSQFVQRRGHQLYLWDKPWYFIGANAYWLMDFAKYPDRRGMIDGFFDKCNEYGLKVIRMWAFNHRCPSSWGVYDETEMKGFDYILDSAGRHGIKLILALGNTWTAYRSPEDFMKMAGEPVTDLLGFYRSDKVKSLYKDHILYMVNRKNTYNGKFYKEDPAIMMWDVFNEPRCPGCTEQWQQQVHQAWIKEMADTLKWGAPYQLVAAGTEGYFMDSSNIGWNPGAGVYCEGEDWLKINQIGSIDVTISHTYDRQMESVPPTWRQPTWDDFMNWFQKYMDAHERAARSVGKPHIMEEFNVIFPKHSESQRAQLFQMVGDYMSWQQQSGGSFSGAMFWNAAVGSDVFDDGYNIYLDVVNTPAAAPAPTPTSSGSSQPAPAPTVEPPRKAITANTETLNDFRRGPQRQACAEQQAKTWQPWWTQSWAYTVNVASYEQRTRGRRVQDIIKDTARQLYHW